MEKTGGYIEISGDGERHIPSSQVEVMKRD
jgi:hypothetical protein